MKAYLICAIFVICASAVLCAPPPPDFRKYMQECMTEASVTEAELKEFFAGGMAGTASNNMKCYSKCLMEKQGHMANGVFNADSMLNAIKNVPQLKEHEAEITSGIEACKNEKGTDDCDTAFKITMCLKDHKAIPH